MIFRPELTFFHLTEAALDPNAPEVPLSPAELATLGAMDAAAPSTIPAALFDADRPITTNELNKNILALADDMRAMNATLDRVCRSQNKFDVILRNLYKSVNQLMTDNATLSKDVEKLTTDISTIRSDISAGKLATSEIEKVTQALQARAVGLASEIEQEASELGRAMQENVARGVRQAAMLMGQQGLRVGMENDENPEDDGDSDDLRPRPTSQIAATGRVPIGAALEVWKKFSFYLCS